MKSTPQSRPGTLSVWREREFVFFVISRFFSGSAMTLLRATFGWQIFAITGSAFHLGLIGLVQFGPTLLLSLLGGAIADTYDRRRVVMLSTPDALRGRVSSVNLVFIGASNQLGAVESGFLAALTSATFAVVSGGIACLAVLALVAVKLPGLRHYRVDQLS